MVDKTDAPLIAGTLERYVYLSQQTVATHVLAFVKQIQNATPILLAAIPELPPLVDRMKELWPEVPDDALAKLKAGLSQLASAKLSFATGGVLERFCLETFVTRQIDSFESYLSQIVERCLRAHPDALGDSQISLRELRECASIDDAIARRIEHKVRDLTFSGLAGIVDFLKKVFGIDINSKTDSYRAVCEAIEVRHLIVHKGSKVDRVFISRTGRSTLTIGELYPLDWNFARGMLDALSAVTEDIDRAVIQRLRITQ